MFMEIARVVSKRSTCFRLNVGAILVQDNRIISMGYNGEPPGYPHCSRPCNAGECNTIHAERNAIDHRAVTKNCGKITLYVTDSPCASCAQAIIDAGIHRVLFSSFYRDLSPVSLLITNGIPVYRILPNGCVIDMATNRVMTPEELR
jgi:dCMP deaminase